MKWRWIPVEVHDPDLLTMMAKVRTLSEFTERLKAIGERPGMYFCPPYYEKLSSFIDGCDFVFGDSVISVLAGELKSLGAPGNLVWDRAFLATLLGNENAPWEVIRQDPAEDLRACRALIEWVVKCCDDLIPGHRAAT